MCWTRIYDISFMRVLRDYILISDWKFQKKFIHEIVKSFHVFENARCVWCVDTPVRCLLWFIKLIHSSIQHTGGRYHHTERTPDGRDLSHVADGVGNISLFIVQVSLRRWIPPPQTIDLFLGKATRRQVSAIANVKR